MEREFKVGDQVEGEWMGIMAPRKRKVFGKIIHRCFVCGAWVVEDVEGREVHVELESLRPYIPADWMSADEPPDNIRDVKVLLRDGSEKLGWYDGGVWFSYKPGSNNAILADELPPGEVIGWKKIGAEQPTKQPEATLHYVSPSMSTAKAYAAKPEPTRRWCVAANLPTTITTWHDTYEGAVNEAKRLFKKTGQTFRVLEVVMEIEPGDPVIREYTDNPF